MSQDRFAPLIGAVVWVWCPLQEQPDTPGPKYRPCLVCGVSQDSIQLAYGTSQVHRITKGEFLVEPEELPGLPRATKFNLGKQFSIPKDTAFFLKDGRLNAIGRLPPRVADEAIQAGFGIGMFV